MCHFVELMLDASLTGGLKMQSTPPPLPAVVCLENASVHLGKYPIFNLVISYLYCQVENLMQTMCTLKFKFYTTVLLWVAKICIFVCALQRRCHGAPFI